jgi:predicted SprT family Zn-dependent metalloprotease
MRDGFVSMSVHRRLLATSHTPWAPVRCTVGEFVCTECRRGFQTGYSRTVQYENKQLRQYRCPACKEELTGWRIDEHMNAGRKQKAPPPPPADTD